MKNLIDTLNPEGQQKQNELKLEDNQNLTSLIDRFEYGLKWYEFIDYKKIYDCLKKLVIPKDYSASDILQFSLCLNKYEELQEFSLYTGYYLSALINNCKENHIFINTQSLQKPICSLGYMNCGKDITIIGNGGKCLGQNMISGNIIVEGNAGFDVGSYSKSSLTIRLFGNYDSIGSYCFAKVYHKGKQIKTYPLDR